MFGRYALPTDDAAGAGTVTASAADPDYPAGNLVAASNSGHLNLPSRPAKLTAGTGYWDVTLPGATAVVAAALIYHNLDAALNVTLEPSGGTPVPITIPAHTEDGATVSPWVEFAPQTATVWRLAINGTNSINAQVGRLLLLTSLRELATDVRWGVEEIEDHDLIEHTTERGVETIYDLGGKRRSFSGEFGVPDDQAGSLISLARSAHGRVQPWLLIPDEAVNDAWLVRYQESRWNRTRATLNFNTMPFSVRELSRGVQWP